MDDKKNEIVLSDKEKKLITDIAISFACAIACLYRYFKDIEIKKTENE